MQWVLHPHDRFLLVRCQILSFAPWVRITWGPSLLTEHVYKVHPSLWLFFQKLMWYNMWYVYLKATQHPSPYTEGRLFPHPLNSGLVEEFTMRIHLISVSCLLIYVHHPIQYPTLHIHVYRVITHMCLQCSAHWCLFRLKKLLLELSTTFLKKTLVDQCISISLRWPTKWTKVIKMTYK